MTGRETACCIWKVKPTRLRIVHRLLNKKRDWNMFYLKTTVNWSYYCRHNLLISEIECLIYTTKILWRNL